MPNAPRTLKRYYSNANAPWTLKRYDSNAKSTLDAQTLLSEVGGENGAKRSPLPGIQAQRPSPSHRTHDTTDQWREIVRRLGRSEANFRTHRPFQKNTSRVSGESLSSFRSF